MSDIGLSELVVGVGMYWLLDWIRKPPGKIPEEKKKIVPSPDDVEQDVISAGGVDPQMVDRLLNQVTERGLILGSSLNRMDNARSFAQLVKIASLHPIELSRKEIPPPPAPNTMRALNLTKERLLRHSDILKKNDKSEVVSVFVG